MTDPTTSADAADSVAAMPNVGSALRRLARATLKYAVAKRESWTRQLEGTLEPSGATDRAVVEGLKAWATGGNPIREALHAAWSGADAKTKAAIVATLLLVAVLSPVLLLLLLLAALIIVVVLKARKPDAALL